MGGEGGEKPEKGGFYSKCYCGVRAAEVLVGCWAAGPDECTDAAGWVLQAVALGCWRSEASGPEQA